MPTIVRSGGGGTDISDATATKDKVLQGYSFYSGNSDEKQDGQMPSYSLNSTLEYNETVTGFGAGYYSSINIKAPNRYGTATADQVLQEYSFMNSTSNVSSGNIVNYGAQSRTLNFGDTTTLNGKGYYTSISITAPSLSGNAKPEHVLSGCSFLCSSGSKTGTLTNRGSVTCNIGFGGKYTQTTAGYYSSINIYSPSLTGTALNNQVLSEITFMNSSGVQTGTMTNKGKLSCTSLAAGTWKNSGAGYYTSINIYAQPSTVSSSDYYSFSYYMVGGSFCNTGIVYNSSHKYGVAYVSLPTDNSKNGLKFFCSGGYLWITQQGSSASQTNVRLTTIIK